jgi:hypothetical protein
MSVSSSSRAPSPRRGRPVDGRELSERLAAVQSTAFRLETLQHYAGDEEELDEFRRGLPLRERSVRTSPYLRRLAEATLAGQQWSRIHVIEKPLTDYVRFELASYVGSAAAGEQIMVADRSAAAELGELRQDFWLVDKELPGAVALMMHYDQGGEFLGATAADDGRTLAWCRHARFLAASHAVPLNDYIARQNLRVA